MLNHATKGWSKLWDVERQEWVSACKALNDAVAVIHFSGEAATEEDWRRVRQNQQLVMAARDRLDKKKQKIESELNPTRVEKGK